ncbi:hypothetical protein Golob_023957, partial [Gossypium lobatum]|nr:hypothetical protein [Gossypium lobatum]
LAQYWNPTYSCFTFKKVDLILTIEEYIALLHCLKIQIDKIYSKATNVPTFLNKLMNITGMSKQWIIAQIKQKEDCKCIPLRSLRDLILAHPDMKKKVDVFALSIYGLVVFPKALGYVDERAGEGRFIGCAQLLLSWFRSHFWRVEKVSYRVFSEDYSPLKELVATPRDFDWVLLLGIWEAVGYAPLFGDNYKNKIREMYNTWNQTHRMKRFTVRPMTTPEYYKWWSKELMIISLGRVKKNFHDTRVWEDALKKHLLESQSKKERLRARVAELERSLQQYHSRNFLRVEMLETNNERWKEQLHRSQDQVKERVYVMGGALNQVREVADHLQTLAAQADVQSVKYELESDRGRELDWLLRQVKAL